MRSKLLNVKHTCQKCGKKVFLQHAHKEITCLWCDGKMVPKEKTP